MWFFREIVRWIVALACAGWVSMTLAQAPAWKPDKNIEIVVGASAGGGQDTAARLVHKLRTVVFKSGGVSVSALLGGHIDVMTSTTAAALPHHRAGKARILAVAASRRISGELADVPTWRELGSDAVLSSWKAYSHHRPRRADCDGRPTRPWMNSLRRVTPIFQCIVSVHRTR